MEDTKFEEPKSGFTFASCLAVLYSIFVFIPSVIYLQLMVGTGGIPISWFTVVLFVELARLLGYNITRQEAAMIFIISSAVIFTPIDLVYRGYFRTSEIAHLFGIANEIPSWYAPFPETGVYELRTIFHPAWFVPLLIYFLEIAVVSISTWGLAFLSRKLYIEEEDLPFPIQQISATAIMTLSEERRKMERSRLLFVAVIGFIYGFILYALPFLVKAYTGVQLTLIPVPWIDLTSNVETVFPGALFGIATDLSPIVAALVLPTPTVLGIILGSFAIYFFGNWLSVIYDLAVQPWWVPKIPIQMALQRCILYMWGIPIMGLGMAGGIVPVLLRYLRTRQRKDAMVSRASKRAYRERFDIRKWAFIPIIISWISSIFFYMYLSPAFPIWLVLPFILVMPITLAIVDGRMLGETGVTFAEGQTVNLMRLLYWVSGYQGVDVWFVPTPWRSGGAGILSQMKVCDLTNTSIKSFFKMWWTFLPIGILTGLMYVQLFWSIAPIPSGRYPGAEIFWPVSVVNSCLWIRGIHVGLFRMDWLIGSFILGSILALVFDISGLNTFVSFIGVIAGTVTFTPFAVTYGIGFMIRIFLWKILGKKFFEENKQLIAAGLLMGQGIAIMLGISLVLIINSIWFLPF